MCQALFQNYSFCLKVNAIKSCWQSDLSLKSFFFFFFTILDVILNVVDL